MSGVDHDVIVVGGGPGGLACAARLAHWGVRVLLLERNDRTGGKAVTVERDGFRYELGPKLQVPMRGPAFAELFDELGIPDRLRQVMLTRARICYRPAGETEYRALVNEVTDEGSDGSEMFDLWGLDEAQRARAVEIMAGMVLLAPEQLDGLDGVTMEEYLAKVGDVPEALYQYLGMHANASLAEPIDRVSASEQIKIMQQLALQGGGGLLRGGFGRMLDDLAEAVREKGERSAPASRWRRSRSPADG
ncbi:MAG: FAD-dependent oxidoreductase [Acidimicrobiia bacterium]|nr:FAD-dependent oxidoreductase [Acidimicrobiia bacterium]